jgi:hypothetical protein
VQKNFGKRVPFDIEILSPKEFRSFLPVPSGIETKFSNGVDLGTKQNLTS